MQRMMSSMVSPREDLLRKLRNFCETADLQQAECARQMAEFVRNTPDCFERSHRAGHITGSAWVLNPSGKRALLTLHRRLGRWLQPGGHADGEGDTLAVALREAREESGINELTPLSVEIFDVDIHAIPASTARREPEHLHYDVRYLFRAAHERFTVSDESIALGWFTPEEMGDLDPAPDVSVLRLARKAACLTNSGLDVGR